jgi:cobalt/nickel transport system permease protein
MRHDFLDRHARLDTPVHRLPAALKFVAALSSVILVLLLSPSRPIFLAPMALFLFAVAWVSRIPWRFLAWRLFLLEPFVLGVAILALFGPGGWRLFLFLVAKCTLCLLVMVLLSNTTPFSDLLRVLKAARMPALLVTTLSLMYRYLFVLADEAQRMKRARMSRTFTPRRLHSWRTISTVVSQLFLRASERAERIYGAMSARGWR